MDKEEAIKILKNFHDKSALFSVRTALETLHPELKESEDERIRKELIEHVKDQQSSFISAPDCRDKYEEEENNKYNSWLFWLEKQGTYTKKDVDDAFVEGMALAKNELEKQGEQKNKIYPATKEQRDTLFAKMKESGYEWNAEKKELKKIEQPKLTAFEEEVKDMMDDYRDAIDENAATTEEVKERAAYLLSLIPHKPAEWSEEDESNIKALESILYYDKKLPKDLYLRLNDWLKSLRPQNRWKVVDKGIYVKEPALAQKKDKSEPGQGFVVCYDHILTPDVYERYIMLSDINCHSGWKPSDKQMEALLSEVNGWVKGCPKQIVLESLYDDLKKLKG